MNVGTPSGPGLAGWQGECGTGAQGFEIPDVEVPGHLGGSTQGRPRIRFSPQEAGRPDPLAVRCAERRAEVRALARGNVVCAHTWAGACVCARVYTHVWANVCSHVCEKVCVHMCVLECGQVCVHVWAQCVSLCLHAAWVHT